MHPLVRAAGERGELPAWARCAEERLEHLERVTGLLVRWSEELGQSAEERTRWAAAGRLHDALRDATEVELREWSDVDWPTAALHGPACAARLREEGVRDEELLLAVSHHTVGHPDFGDLGVHLYLADFLDPGREFLVRERAEMRERVPERSASVLLEVVRLRLDRLLAGRRRIRPETLAFWNRRVSLADGRGG